jgi:hypothetical protein
MHDVRRPRESKGTPKQVDIYAYVYDIDTDELSLVVEDKVSSPAPASQDHVAVVRQGTRFIIMA